MGIPEVFAKRLSWPEPVNQHNVRRLRQAVLNGPDAWPGANYVVDEKGNKVDLSKKGQQFRTALAKQLQRHDSRGLNWKVGRHLNNGDFVLVNRQPTLHKVSLFAHVHPLEPFRQHFVVFNKEEASKRKRHVALFA